MKTTLIISTLLSIFVSCHQDNRSLEKLRPITISHTQNLDTPQSFLAQRLIIFNRQNDYENVRQIQDFTFLRSFDKDLKGFYVHGYLCCPETKYHLELQDTLNRRNFFDVIFSYLQNDSVIILNTNRNYGYKISKQLWERLFSKSQKVNTDKHVFSKYEDVKEFLLQCEKENTPVICNEDYYNLTKEKYPEQDKKMTLYTLPQ